MTKLTAHDFSKSIKEGYSFGGKSEDIIRGLEKMIALIKDRSMTCNSVAVTSKIEPEDFTSTVVIIKLYEK